MIKIHQPLLTVKPMLFYVAGGPTPLLKVNLKAFLKILVTVFFISILRFLCFFFYSHIAGP